MQTIWLRPAFQISKWTLQCLILQEMRGLWRWRSVPVLKDTLDLPARTVMWATPVHLDFILAPVRSASATGMLAVVTQRLEIA